MTARLFAVVIVLAARAPGWSWAQEGKTAREAGMAIATKRGHANPACYADIFAAHASQNRQGQWRAPTGKAALGYKQQQFSKCGISI